MNPYDPPAVTPIRPRRFMWRAFGIANGPNLEEGSRWRY